jgi:hypothetical protein
VRRVAGTRNQILGHSPVAGRYGRKGAFDPKQIKTIEALEPDVVQETRKILMEAKSKVDVGNLMTIKTWPRPSFNRGNAIA